MTVISEGLTELHAWLTKLDGELDDLCPKIKEVSSFVADVYVPRIQGVINDARVHVEKEFGKATLRNDE